MSQFLREFWCLDVSCLGPSCLSCGGGPIWSELRCLAAGQPSWPISVEAPLWSQVVGSTYREDQQRSVSLVLSRSPALSLSLSLALSPSLPVFDSPTSPPSFSFLLFSALFPFDIIPLPVCVFPLTSQRSHLYIITVSLLLVLSAFDAKEYFSYYFQQSQQQSTSFPALLFFMLFIHVIIGLILIYYLFYLLFLDVDNTKQSFRFLVKSKWAGKTTSIQVKRFSI